MRYLAAPFIFCLIYIAPCATAQQDPLDAVATDAAAAISKAIAKQTKDNGVLVDDFAEARGIPTALGPYLARQFVASLQAHAHNFTFADRDEFLRQFSSDRLSPDLRANPESMKCYSTGLTAAFIVTGELEDLPDTVILRIKVIRIRDHKRVFDTQATLQLTPVMQRLVTQTSEMFNSSISKPSAARQSSGERTAGENGYSMPSCISCPNPHFSRDAVTAQRQGTVTMSVRVGANGLVEDATVIRGLPCGLNKQAIDAVRKWKLSPSIGPDGQPSAVITTVEVTFRLRY